MPDPWKKPMQEWTVEDVEKAVDAELAADQVGHDQASPFLGVITKRLSFTYRNWRGEVSTRVVEPIDIWFGSTEWHPERQWLMSGSDLAKGEIRHFAMRDMSDVRYVV